MTGILEQPAWHAIEGEVQGGADKEENDNNHEGAVDGVVFHQQREDDHGGEGWGEEQGKDGEGQPFQHAAAEHGGGEPRDGADEDKEVIEQQAGPVAHDFDHEQS